MGITRENYLRTEGQTAPWVRILLSLRLGLSGQRIKKQGSVSKEVL